MAKPRISAIIPTLNEEKNIGRALKALKNQNYEEEYEIIVADGGSEDKTIDIAKAYADDIIIVKEKGIAIGRNAGAKAAKGEILFFVDGDTFLLPDVFEGVDSAFDNGEIVGVAPRVLPTDSSFKNIFPYWFFYRFSKISTIVGRPMLGGMCVAYRKDIFDKVGGFDERLKSGEDLDLSFRMARFGKFRLLDDVYAYTSTRRLDSWGRARYIYKYLKAYLLGKVLDKGEYEAVR